jgi:sugar O-acyltransferase (sialic acid O-acetyltransferase NeuD family)
MGSRGAFAIFGSGGHARVLSELAKLVGFDPVCFIDPFSPEESYLGLPVVGGLDQVSPDVTSFGLGIGLNYVREQVFLAARNSNPGADFPVLVHPSAFVSPSARLEEGSVVLAQAHVGPGAAIEAGALLNSGASLDHESLMRRFSSLGPGAITAGGVELGERAMVGLGASLFQKVSVGADTVIGASSMVRHDVPANSVAFGTPSRVIRTRKIDDPYF